eukprot:m.1140353 g.1140353  ORF g.1140353 m.1140353 type:complete len:917 (+) comp24445_c0_seq4:86-2836(+)
MALLLWLSFLVGGHLVSCSTTSATERSRNKFDFGWRFHLGDPHAVSPDEFRRAATNFSDRILDTNTQNCTAGSPCDPTFDDTDWRHIAVPHDFVVEGTFNKSLDPNHGALATNVSWYRKTFDIATPASPNSLVYLTFDGVFRSADVYINGIFVKHHEEGYTSFVVFIHNASLKTPLRYGAGGNNVVAVYVDATQPELWCYEGGGIYRHVWLETAAATSIVPWGFSVVATIDGPIEGTDATKPQTTSLATLHPQFDIANAQHADFNGTAVVTLADDAGNIVLSSESTCRIPMGGFLRMTPGQLSFGSSTARVKLWNTASSPPLYVATVSLYEQVLHGNLSSDRLLDVVTTRIGIRSAVFDAERGFVLNGVKVWIKGTSNHLGFGGVGLAVPDRVQEFQIANLKRMGSNAFRTAHNPVSPELLDFADQYGMLVWEENRFVTHGVQPIAQGRSSSAPADNLSKYIPPTDKDADPRLLSDAQDMVLRDRNHPSIIIWSLCNELGCVANDPNGGDLAIQFKLALYAADKSRPITGNTVQTPYLGGKYVDGFSLAMDVQSFSYDYDAYAAYHAVSPWKSVGGGESCSCQSDRGYYGPTNRAKGYISMYSEQFPPFAARSHNVMSTLPPRMSPAPNNTTGLFACVERSWKAVVSLPYVYGNFAWTGYDYKGETTLGWPDVSSHYGIHDLAGFAKDSAGYYEAWWRECTADTVGISISPNEWTAPASVNASVTIYVTTCATAVDLFVNGVRQSAGPRPRMERFGFATWEVPFVPGNVTAVGYDTTGTIVATKTIRTAGAPTHLRLTVDSPYNDRRNGSQVAADGQDVALLRVELLDDSSIVVPNADVNVTFSVSGPGTIVGVANGDPADHSPDKASWRQTFHGLARVIVGSARADDTMLNDGDITVVAHSPGLLSGRIVLEAVA